MWSYDSHVTLIDEYARECLAIREARRLGRYEVIEALADVMLFRESPEPGSPWEAQIVIERWRVLSHALRPYSALGYRPPAPRGLQPNGAKSEFAACRCDVDCSH